MSGQYSESTVSGRIPKQPRPLHRTFYESSGSTTNREQDRWNIRHYRKHRISARTIRANTVKRQIKSIRLRQYIGRTISHFLKDE